MKYQAIINGNRIGHSDIDAEHAIWEAVDVALSRDGAFHRETCTATAYGVPIPEQYIKRVLDQLDDGLTHNTGGVSASQEGTKMATIDRGTLRQSYRERIADVRRILGGSPGDDLPDNLGEYGLGFDYVEAGTFNNRKPYYRYQFSWGGPSEEVRYIVDHEEDIHPRVEFWHLDWFAGECVKVRKGSRNYEILMRAMDYFRGDAW